MVEPTDTEDTLRAGRPGAFRLSATEIIALVLSLGWLAVAGLFFLTAPAAPPDVAPDPLRFVLTMLAIFLPVAMIWVAAASARAARVMREEARRLQSSVDAMRQTYLADRQGRAGMGNAAVMAKPPVSDAAAVVVAPVAETSDAETPTPAPTPAPEAEFASKRLPVRQPLPTAHQPIAPEDQPSLALGSPGGDEPPSIDRDDMVRALNFPDDPTDEIGFSALRRALKERNARKLIQASQDVLTLLSQDGIYMDDLTPDRARPSIWRRFATGERGRAIAALGGIRDRSSLALAAGRMREDPIFRDAAHHFLRLYDRMLVEFEDGAEDVQIAALAETRSARAFMLLGRVAGSFD